jgi:antirestriction protein ArdC
MKLFKDSNNNVFAYEEDGSQDSLIGNKTPITETEAADLEKQKQDAAFNALSYGEKRALYYPPMADYVDGVVKNDQAQIDKYIAECLEVKATYPKP